jgi:HK97 family phage major capsid protein
MSQLKKLIERRSALRRDCKQMLAKAEAENRELTAEELAAYKKNEDELGEKAEDGKLATGIEAEIARQERLAAWERDEAKAVVNPGSAPAEKPEELSKKPIKIEGIARKSRFFQSNEDAYLSGRFIRAAIEGREADVLWCREHGVASLAASTSHSSNNNAQGGLLIPTQFATTLINLKETYGVFAASAKRWPMSSDVLQIPRRSGGVTAYYVAENTDITASRATFDFVQLTARKLSAMCVYPQELADDAAIALADHLVSEMAYAFAKAEDDAGFIGDGTSTYGGITGIMSAIGAGSVYTAASSHDSFEDLTLDDFEGAVAKLPAYALPRAAWYVSSAGFAASMMRLAYAAGGNTTEQIAGGVRKTFLGYPVVISQSLNSTLGTDASKNKLIFGDLSLSSAYGDRQMFSVKADSSRYFEADQVAVKATQRFDIVNHDMGTASVAGPVVVLKTSS